MTFGLLLGIILGIALGTALGFVLVMNRVKDSNDLGDSKGGYANFSTTANVTIIHSRNRVSKKEFTMLIQENLPVKGH